MPASKFSSVITVEDWTTALAAILDDVERAVESGKFRKKSELQDLLFEFIEASPTSAESLDRIARRAAEDLLKAQVHEAAAGIATRNAELEEVTKLIHQSTVEAKDGVRVLQFEKVMESLESVRAGLEALMGMREGLTDDDADLMDRLVEIAGAIEDFQKLAEGTVG
jgi:hypothetical protein